MELEKDIEKKVCGYAWRIFGVRNSKISTPGQRGYPDRVFWIRGGRPLFIEFKRKGEQLRPLQAAIVKRLRDYGYEVKVCDNYEDGCAYISAAVAAARLSKEGA